VGRLRVVILYHPLTKALKKKSEETDEEKKRKEADGCSTGFYIDRSLRSASKEKLLRLKKNSIVLGQKEGNQLLEQAAAGAGIVNGNSIKGNTRKRCVKNIRYNQLSDRISGL